MFRKRSRFWIVSALALSTSFVTASWGRANERATEFNIPPQSLDSALLVFAEQADVQVSVSTVAIAGMRTPGVVGNFTPSVALSRLLVETGLRFSTVGDRTYAVAQEQVMPGAGAQQTKASSPSTAPATPSGNASPASADTKEGAKKKNPRSDADGEIGKAAELGDLTVTGTNIRGVSPDSSPTIAYDRKDIERSGATTVAEFARKIPQNFSLLDGETFFNAGGDNTVSGNNTRAGAINLRGLGPESTLVLMNGRRLAPSGFDGSFVDVSTIPLSAVERIEVLTDGGAALYGADAVAGVVNFVLRRSFDGAETSLQWGDSTDGGAGDLTASQAIGRSWSSGNGLLVYEYSDQEKLQTSQRSYIQDQGGVFDIFPGQRRHSVIASIRQELSPTTELYADALFSDRQFDQTTTSFGALVEENGGATASSGALGVGHDFSSGWRSALTGSYSRMREDREGTVTFGPDVFPFVFETDSTFSSLDVLTDGPLFEISGGKVRASLGATARREEIRSVAFGTTTESKRNVVAAFGEIFVPLVGASNVQPWATRLEFSAAVRYDHYDDAGSSTDPRLGLLWSPIAGLNLRGTYSTSYRTPTLLQLVPGREYIIFNVPDPMAADGSSVTIFPTLPGNPALGPERSSSFTFGLDFRPATIPSLSFSATYFDIDFTDRIRRPTDGISLFDIFEQEAILGPTVVDRSPDPAEIQRIFDNGIIEDFVGGTTPADIEVFLDTRLRNIAATKTSGLDVSAEYGIDSTAGQFQLFLAGTYLLDLDFRAASTTPTVSRLNQVFNPIDLRLQGGVSWTGGHTSSSLTLNYSDSYRNPLVTPTEKVESWVTADWQLSYQWDESSDSSLLSGLTIALNVHNLSNAEPPRIASNPAAFFDLRFDSTNASPKGRFVSLNLRKKW